MDIMACLLILAAALLGAAAQALWIQRRKRIRVVSGLLRERIRLKERAATLELALASERTDRDAWKKERDELMELTSMLDEHPEDYDGPCMCRLCREYGTDPGDMELPEDFTMEPTS